MRLTLASQSPRRLELLRLLGVEPEVRPARVDEALRPGETPEAYVRRVAIAKAESVEGEVVLGADTAVVLDGAVLGKPAGAEEARRMLRALSGRVHRVLTAVCLRRGARRAEALVSSEVLFADLEEARIAWYLAGGEPLDKAGAYALQGQGGALVREVRGSVSNVVGLPLHETEGLLREIGFPVAWGAR
jgi:septum formation protein